MNILDSIRHEGLRDDVPDFRVGDTVKVQVRVREGSKTRLQLFQGVVIDRKGSAIEACFTVRKLSSGVAVESVALTTVASPEPRFPRSAGMISVSPGSATPSLFPPEESSSPLPS